MERTIELINSEGFKTLEISRGEVKCFRISKYDNLECYGIQIDIPLDSQKLEPLLDLLGIEQLTKD